MDGIILEQVRQIKNLNRIIEQLGQELKKKDEIIAAINTHGRALELETRELKEQLRKRGQ